MAVLAVAPMEMTSPSSRQSKYIPDIAETDSAIIIPHLYRPFVKERLPALLLPLIKQAVILQLL
jgi:hypothetical protein